MKRKSISTALYLLQENEDDNKGFGYVYGFAKQPDYSAEVRFYIKGNKFESNSDVDDTKLVVLNEFELESIGKAAQCVRNSLETMISLARRNMLKDECFEDE